MMLYQQTAFAGLALLNHLAHAVTPVAVGHDAKQYGYVGYVGYLPTPPSGDWVTTTYCYCAQPQHLDAPHFDEGAFFQYEYYSHHRNTTYVMLHQCQANHDEWRTCVNSRNVQKCEPQSDVTCNADMNMICSSWPRSHALGKRGFSSEEVKEDHWCMTLDFRVIGEMVDEITWNKQTRYLTKYGGQGRNEQPEGDVQAVCEGLCQDHVGMPMLRVDNNARSRQEVFVDVDDMCDTCR